MTDPADLSDAELCEAVAREVLGWNRADPMLHPDEFSQPTDLLSWSGIGQVVEAMRERGFHYSTEWDHGENPFVLFVKWDENDEPNAAGKRGYEDPARAVFEAALAAVRNEAGDARE